MRRWGMWSPSVTSTASSIVSMATRRRSSSGGSGADMNGAMVDLVVSFEHEPPERAEHDLGDRVLEERRGVRPRGLDELARLDGDRFDRAARLELLDDLGDDLALLRLPRHRLPHPRALGLGEARDRLGDREGDGPVGDVLAGALQGALE